MSMSNRFKNANEAFVYYYNMVDFYGELDDTGNKVRYNEGFTILNPLDREITASFRHWSKSYAEREWAWYMSEDRSVEKIKQYAPMWDAMHSGDNIVNSNYGWQLNRSEQLEKAIHDLKTKPGTRRAAVSIFDGKEKDEYEFDTPCTMGIVFYIQKGRLNMSVYMRSNDLWYGFCNDQYCFSKFQEYVARRVGVRLGWYYHHATNLHLYPDHFGLNSES